MIAVALSVAIAVGFMLVGMLIDIKIISKYDSTPISFTFTFLCGGICIGGLMGLRTARVSKIEMKDQVKRFIALIASLMMIYGRWMGAVLALIGTSVAYFSIRGI